MSRYFSDYVTETGRTNLSLLVDKATNPYTYSDALYKLGLDFGHILSKQINDIDKGMVTSQKVEATVKVGYTMNYGLEEINPA